MHYLGRFFHRKENHELCFHPSSLLYQIRTNVLLNKNPDKNQNWMLVVNELIEKNILSSILCLQPFIKTKFLAKLIDKSNHPIIYIDFDLMFSGYVDGGVLPIRKNVIIIRPTKKNWKKTLQMILLKISLQKFSVIIDSLNGFYILSIR